MAVLSKHGEIGQIEKLAHKVAYCSDGQILRNQGDGWKVWKKLKPGFVPAESFERSKANYAQKLHERPAFAAWRSTLHDLVSFSQRYMVVTVISAMPQDPDGVWSECNDILQIDLSIDDCVQLCRAYDSAEEEAKAMAPMTTAAPQIVPGSVVA